MSEFSVECVYINIVVAISEFLIETYSPKCCYNNQEILG